MYTLYYAPGAASLVVHWLLLELDVPFEARRLDVDAREHKQAAYLALNPAGVIPTLLVDGKPVVETGAIVALLAARHPDKALMPSAADERYPAFLQAMFRISNGLQPPFRHWFYPQDITDESGTDTVKQKVRAQIEGEWDRWSTWIGSSAGGYLLGGQVSAVDFYLTMVMRWSRNMPRPATDWAPLAEFAQRMKARPSFAELYRREGLTEWS